jgi:hypothetical protein
VLQRLSKRLMQMKLILYGDGEKEIDKDKCQVGFLHALAYRGDE